MTAITSITLAQWRTRVRDRADLYQSAFVADGYVGSAGGASDGYGGELATMINDSLNTSYDFLIEAFGDEFFMNECKMTLYPEPAASATNIGTWIGTTGTVDNYPISPWKLLSVKFLYNNYYYPCKRKSPNQTVTDFLQQRNWVPGGVYYTYHWEYIKFYPNPSSTQNVVTEIIPALKPLYYPWDTLVSAMTSTPINQHPLDKFSDLTVLDCAIKCLNKQERDTAPLLIELQTLKEHIIKNVPRLDRTPRTIIDAERNKLQNQYDWFNRYGT